MKEKIVVVGGGGHAKVVIDAAKKARKIPICGIVDGKLRKGISVMGVRVLGDDAALRDLFENGVRKAFIGVGSVGNSDVRKNIYRNLKKIGFILPVIKHPSAVVAASVKVGEGAFIAAGTVINPCVKIGKNAIINTRASIDHDCRLGDFVHVAPGVTISGAVSVGEETHIGTGANIINNVKIGKKCIIAAGETVRLDIKDGKTYRTDRCFADLSKKRKKVFIIAEAGVNHNGSLATARKLIDVAAKAGADAVKFQIFKTENLVSISAPKAPYQRKTKLPEESHFEMLKKLELRKADWEVIAAYCRKKRIMFLASAFDEASVRFLKKIGIKFFKIPSGEINNLPYLRKTGQYGKKIIMSSGMADMSEIKTALKVLTEAGTPKKNVIVLQCNTDYPTPVGDANLRAMLWLKRSLGVSVGYSDHTRGIEVAIAAAALGAEIIEKHFTLDNNAPGPDHKASLNPTELEEMIRSIRNVEKALGNGSKRVSPSESKNRLAARKSIVASGFIKKGDIFTEKNIATKRPAVGMNPMKWDKVMGKRAQKDFLKDEPIKI